ncbi:Gfo/Idh/MocA family oxidoreductase [Aquimarina sp. D1M17]|uniref:Gfo/Idh/MocA family protein n=1 Tax=Aquimarina acroporae TaxID=2937283 RepID=UPI0020C00BAA|nr:Gfo/Idh/MocA family oxidoreductase [Aquimarina acroporae]MCK8521747.1 Gfo/Idh/MocA family oxidoreductase [Aquimarina acroporae]
MGLHKVRWGILGLGNIANQFAKDMALVPDAELVAVGSRSMDKAVDFAQKYGAQRAYNTYDQVINDGEVDIIYIATPHNSHAELTIQSLNAGKHVLCEKPVALNFSETVKMVEASKTNGKFFMEAFWTRFNPSIREVYSKVDQNEIGDIKYINADFAFNIGVATGRMIDPLLGGGSLMDMGVYPLFLSYLVLGKPKEILAASNFYATGADKQTSIILQYQDAQAVLHSSFVSPSDMKATVSGTEGRIRINSIWHETQSYTVIKNNHEVDYHFPTKGKGFTYEIEECHRCIHEKKLESDLWSHEDSLNLIQMVDEVRKQTGLEFASQEN